MSRKPKFRPQVTRIKLNPEQAVLTCDCFYGQRWWSIGGITQYAVAGSWVNACTYAFGVKDNPPGWSCWVGGTVEVPGMLVSMSASS